MKLLLKIQLTALLFCLFPINVYAAIDFVAVSNIIVEKGDENIARYTVDNATQTGNEFSRLYFDVFESSGMEFRLGMQNPEAKTTIESGFAQVIQSAMRGDSPAKLQESWLQLRTQLKTISLKSNESVQSTFISAFLILFREGVEAMLLVSVLITYLRRSGAGDKQHVIWWGVGVALIASLITAWAFNRMVFLTGATRELVEGGTMLLAAAVLLYVSYWLFAKREADRWQDFIKGQLDQALSTGNLLTLGTVAFLAVYREGAETVLFYQALLADADASQQEALAGAGVALLALTVVFFCYRVLSVKLPLRLFFSLTAILMFVLAVIFTGKGLLELQVIGMVSSTPLTEAPHWEWLGVFPTAETLAAQGVLLLLLVIVAVFSMRGHQRV